MAITLILLWLSMDQALPEQPCAIARSMSEIGERKDRNRSDTRYTLQSDFHLKKDWLFFVSLSQKKTDPANIKSKDLLPLKFSRVSTYWKKNFKLFFLVQTKTSGKQFLKRWGWKKNLERSVQSFFFTLSLLSNKLYGVYLRL